MQCDIGVGIYKLMEKNWVNKKTTSIDTWYVKGWIAENWERTIFSNGIFSPGQPDSRIHMDKNVKSDLYLIPYIIISSEQIADLSVKKSKNTLQDDIEKYLCKLGSMKFK